MAKMPGEGENAPWSRPSAGLVSLEYKFLKVYKMVLQQETEITKTRIASVRKKRNEACRETKLSPEIISSREGTYPPKVGSEHLPSCYYEPSTVLRASLH